MIRKLLNGDIDRVADIWLKTNLRTHYFISNQYWKSNYELVKELMSQSEIYVFEADKMIQGFVGLNDEYIDRYRPQIYRILSKNGLEGRCMASLRSFMKKQIGQIISKCPGTRDFSVREDIMVDYYAATLEMLLEKCFFAKEQLSKEEALQTVDFLLGSVEKEDHKK